MECELLNLLTYFVFVGLHRFVINVPIISDKHREGTEAEAAAQYNVPF